MSGEARRVFELGEPLEPLSGRLIPDDNSRPKNFRNLLREWAKGAVIVREPREVAQVIRRVRLEPDRFQRGEQTTEEISRRLQNWLLLQAALACCERDDWASWQILIDALDEKTDQLERFDVLLRSAQRLQSMGDTDRSRKLLCELCDVVEPGEPWNPEAHIAVAELALWVGRDQGLTFLPRPTDEYLH